MKPRPLNNLPPAARATCLVQRVLFLAAIVWFSTHVSLAQDSKTSKIPEEEAQFTAAQLEQYYLVYKNSDVRYLRTLFDTYLKSSGGTEDERELLREWEKGYFRSKFIVLSRDGNTFGGTLITILFQDRPDKVFVAWVYPEGDRSQPRLRAFKIGDFNDEDLRRIRVRYKKFIEDKTHAM